MLSFNLAGRIAPAWSGVRKMLTLTSSFRPGIVSLRDRFLWNHRPSKRKASTPSSSTDGVLANQCRQDGIATPIRHMAVKHALLTCVRLGRCARRVQLPESDSLGVDRPPLGE